MVKPVRETANCDAAIRRMHAYASYYWPLQAKQSVYAIPDGDAVFGQDQAIMLCAIYDMLEKLTSGPREEEV